MANSSTPARTSTNYTQNPILTDVFYVVSQTNPETKRVSNVLVKRGKELHEPDRMYINPNQIVFVERVGTNSTVPSTLAQDADRV